ncbi:MAG: PAS domain S-box protein, partial [Candidatus Zixiibacteriota bacterium]
LYLSPRSALRLDEHDEYLGKWKPLVERIYQKGGYLFIPEVKSSHHRSGSPRWFSQYFYALKDKSGKVDKVIVLTEDITDRKKIEVALQQSERQFRELTDLLPQTVFEVDVEGRITFANRHGSESTGYTQEDVDAGLYVPQLLIPEDLERVKKNMATRLAGGEPRDHEYTMLRKDGSTFPALIYSAQIVREDKVVGLRGVAVDITQRKEAEIEIKKHRDHLEELVRERSSELIEANEKLRAEIIERKRTEAEVRESGERYRVLFETAGEGILIADYQTRKFRYANPAICRFLGYTADELVGMGVDDIHPIERIEEIHHEFELNSKMPQYIAENIPCLRKDGTIVFADIVGATIYIEGTRYSVGFFRDINELVRGREAFRESEERFRLLAELSPNAISIVRDDQIVFINKAGIRLYGAEKPEDILGRESFDFIHPDYRELVREKRQKVLEENRSSGFKEEKLIRLDGQTVTVDAASAPFTYEGRPAIQVVARDITERKRIEEALKDSELQYRTTIDSMGDSIHVINQNYRIILCNKALREWHSSIGINPDIHGKQLLEVYPFLSEKVINQYKYVFETGETLITTESNEVANRKIVTETRKIPISDGNRVVRIVTVLRDITQRVIAEEALRENEAWLRSTIESLPFDFFALDENGRYILQNSVCRRHWGDLIGTCPEDADVSDYIRQIWIDNNRRALNGETVEGEVDYEFDGQLGHYFNIIAPIFYNGKIRGILGLNMDITDRRRAEDKLRKATEELSSEREALEAKNTALKEVMNQIEDEKRSIKLQIAANIDRVIIPAIQRLREKCGDRLRNQIDNLESSLKTVSAPFMDQLRNKYSQLSPRELEICDMIKKGMMSKDIAEILNVSVLTIHKHRETIRKKLGIKNKEVNLSSFLQNF